MRDDTLYPYKVKIRSGDKEEEVTGNAATAGRARRAICEMLNQRKTEDTEETIVSFEFNGKQMPVEDQNENEADV